MSDERFLNHLEQTADYLEEAGLPIRAGGVRKAADRIRELVGENDRLRQIIGLGEEQVATLERRIRELEAALAHADEVSATFEKAAWDQMGRIRELEAENARLKKLYSEGLWETVQSEQAWKRRAEAAEKRFEALKSAYDKERKRTVEIYGSNGAINYSQEDDGGAS
jgi:chromosome segregation ATPase